MPEINLPTKVVQDDTNTRVKDAQTKVTSTQTTVNSLKTAVDSLLLGRVVKNVQRGTLIRSYSDANNRVEEATISSVDLNKSILLLSSISGNAGGSHHNAVGRIATPTTVRFEYYQNNVGAFKIDWQVIKFY